MEPMTAQINDCQVLYVGQNHETYRGVNQTLRSLGLSVMWVQDIESAEMLAKTAPMDIMLCDKSISRSRNRLFEPSTIAPGTCCVEMSFPKPDPSGQGFSDNIRQSTRLFKVVRNITTVNQLNSN